MLNSPSMEGRNYAGRQLIIDLIGAEKLNDSAYVATALEQCAFAAGAKVISRHLHTFPGSSAISLVILLAESHISIHTWPEKKYAAVDIFMCGDADPRMALPELRKAFPAEEVTVTEHLRGRW
jgi:S-adenosylmethionine decarboxylase